MGQLSLKLLRIHCTNIHIIYIFKEQKDNIGTNSSANLTTVILDILCDLHTFNFNFEHQVQILPLQTCFP